MTQRYFKERALHESFGMLENYPGRSEMFCNDVEVLNGTPMCNCPRRR